MLVKEGVFTAREIRKQDTLDRELIFDEKEHRYTHTLNGETRTLESVTTVIGSYFPPFEAELVARNMVSNNDFPLAARYKKYQPEVDAASNREELISLILKKWQQDADKASALGTAMHAAMECRMRDPSYDVVDGPEYKYGFDYILNLKRMGWIPLYSERRIHQVKWGIAGTVDAMFIHMTTRRCMLVDWKRSKKITQFAFSKKGLGLARDLPDSNYYHYVLQLNFYCVMLESEPYNMSFTEMYIVRLHPNSNTNSAEVIPVPCMRPLVRAMLEERRAMLEERRAS